MHDRAVMAATASPELEARSHLLARGWGLYLLLAVLLIPVLRPSGPAQTAIVDFVNVIGIALFGLVAARYRIPIRLPFLAPILIISIGSLMATMNAVNLPQAVQTLAQDTYLYLWLLVLVALLRDRRDMVRVLVAWVWISNVMSLWAVVQAALASHFSPRLFFLSQDVRTAAGLYNPNMFGDYLMFGIFIVLGLWGRVRRSFLLGSLTLITLAMLTTKSNGSIFSVVVGLAVWLLARTWSRGAPPPRLVGIGALGAGLLVLLLWLQVGLGAGDAIIGQLRQKTFLGRVTKSTQSRGRIWERLESSIKHDPLGIGPGNSSSQPVPIGERETETGFVGKEAHDDYMAYTAERGPLGIIGLLLLTGQMLWMAFRSRRRIVERLGPGAEALWAAIIGALVASAFHSLVIEKLHFRHFWLFLAIATALALEEREPERMAEAPAPRPRPDLSGAEQAPAAVRS